MRGHHNVKAAFLLLAAITGRAGYCAEEVPSDLVLQRFPIAKGGDALLVPVHFGGKDHLFIVDTGCTDTTIDSSLPLGMPRYTDEAETSHDTILVKTYAPPVASVGDLPFLTEGNVIHLDMNNFREAAGHPIEGILGMDFLGRHVVHVDFDRGELLFLKGVPPGDRAVIPMELEPGEVPRVTGFITGSGPIRFMIDTGNISHDCGAIHSRVVKGMVAGNHLTEVGKALTESASGTFPITLYQGSLLALGAFSVEGPVFDENPRHDLLGLGFWSRFAVTFDFPSKMIYLRKGEGHGRPDLINRSGLHVKKKADVFVIVQVDARSPGESAGIRAGDELLSVGGLKANGENLFDLQGALCKSGRVTCEVRRGSQEHRLTITTAP